MAQSHSHTRTLDQHDALYRAAGAREHAAASGPHRTPERTHRPPVLEEENWR
jgi:hypothetical protein